MMVKLKEENLLVLFSWGLTFLKTVSLCINMYIHMYRNIGNILKIHSFHKLLLLFSRFSHVRLCATPEMAAHQAPLSLGFSRQEHWNGLSFPSPMHESEK